MRTGGGPQIPFSVERFSPDLLTTGNSLNRSKLLICKRIFLRDFSRVRKFSGGARDFRIGSSLC